jgi:hypothetical protein
VQADAGVEAAARCGVQGDLADGGAGEVADDGQAEAGAVVVGGGGPPEAVEGTGAVGLGHARSLVDDVQFGARGEGEDDRRAGR